MPSIAGLKCDRTSEVDLAASERLEPISTGSPGWWSFRPVMVDPSPRRCTQNTLSSPPGHARPLEEPWALAGRRAQHTDPRLLGAHACERERPPPICGALGRSVLAATRGARHPPASARCATWRHLARDAGCRATMYGCARWSSTWNFMVRPSRRSSPAATSPTSRGSGEPDTSEFRRKPARQSWPSEAGSLGKAGGRHVVGSTGDSVVLRIVEILANLSR